MKIAKPAILALIVCLLTHDYQARILARESVLAPGLGGLKESKKKKAGLSRSLKDWDDIFQELFGVFVISFLVGFLFGLLMGATKNKKLSQKLKKMAVKQKNKKLKVLARALEVGQKSFGGLKVDISSKQGLVRWLRLARKRFGQHKALLKDKSLRQTRALLTRAGAPGHAASTARKLNGYDDVIHIFFFLCALFGGFSLGYKIGAKVIRKTARVSAKKRALLQKNPFYRRYLRIGEAFTLHHDSKHIDLAKITHFAHAYIARHPALAAEMQAVIKRALKHK